MELIPTPQRPVPRRRRRFLRTLALAGLIATAGLLLAPLAMGLNHTIVRDAGMGAWSWDDSLAVADTVPASDLAVGDVVSFVPPSRYGADGAVTRRVVAINGWSAVTRADESAVPDPWRLDLDKGSFSRVEMRVPLVGRLLLGTGPIWLSGGLAGLLALALVRRRDAVPPAAAREMLQHESVGARRVV